MQKLSISFRSIETLVSNNLSTLKVLRKNLAVVFHSIKILGLSIILILIPSLLYAGPNFVINLINNSSCSLTSQYLGWSNGDYWRNGNDPAAFTDGSNVIPPGSSKVFYAGNQGGGNPGTNDGCKCPVFLHFIFQDGNGAVITTAGVGGSTDTAETQYFSYVVESTCSGYNYAAYDTFGSIFNYIHISDSSDLFKNLPKESHCEKPTPVVSEPTGMPIWAVSEPFISLWVLDEPLGYQPAAGPRVSFELSYKQREALSGYDTNVFSFGKRWNCSWYSYVAQSPDGSVNTVNFRGGGAQSFVRTNFLTNGRLTGDTNSGFTMLYPDGSQEVFGFTVPANGASPFRAFMTKIVNPQGQALTLNYSNLASESGSLVRLQNVVDADGRTNYLFYNASNGYSQNLISHVTDPFGRTTYLNYNTNGDLTGITDVANNSSQFFYKTNSELTNITTPYGVTSFAFTEGADLNQPNGRSIRIERPDGSHELYLYSNSADIDSSSSTPFSTGSFSNSLDLVNFERRNSFHWGPRQYENLSTTNVSLFTRRDYAKAHMKHWLISRSGNDEVSGIISREQLPSPSSSGVIPGLRIFYDYAGKTNQGFEGTQSSPSLILNQLEGQDVYWVHTARNSFGNVSSVTSSYSSGQRDVGYRYAVNEIDILATTNAAGVVVSSNLFNTSHQVLNHFNALNELTSFTYGTNQQVTSITQPNGLVVTNVFDTDNSLLTQIVNGYSTNRYTYTNDLIYTHTDARGLTTTNTWEQLNRLTSIQFPEGSYVSNVYSKLDLQATRDRMGNWTTFGYDSMQRNTVITNALGQVTINTYCTCGALESVLDAGDNLTRFYYDNQGNLIKTLYADGFATTNTYNLRGQIVSANDSSGNSARYNYNIQGLVTSISNSVGLVYSNAYDILDRVTNTINANGVSMGFTYDNLDRLLTRRYPDGGLEQWGYTANVAGATVYTNQLNNISRYAYDLLGRTTNEFLGGVTTNGFAYDGAGDLQSLTDGRNQMTTWHYDNFGRVTNKVDAAGTVSFVYQYNANGQLTNRWTPAKGNTSYAYDAVGNRTNINYGGSQISFTYDPLNRVTNMVDGLGTNSFRYSGAGQMLTAGGLWAGDTVSYTYTNRLRTAAAIGAWAQSYGYDGAKRLSSITSPAGSFGYFYDNTRKFETARVTLPNTTYITNSYDNMGRLRLTGLANGSGRELDGYTYDYNLTAQRTNILRDYGLMTSAVSANYDPIGQVTSWRATEINGAARLNEQLGYAYDAAGNLKQRTNNTFIQAFSVDAANALTNIVRSGTLTVSGNTPAPASSVTVNGQSAVTYADYTFASSNGFALADGNNTFTNIAKNYYGTLSVTNLVSANLPVNVVLQFDANGNLTNDGLRVLNYDAENQLTNITVTGQWREDFAYDGFNRRRISRQYAWQGGSWVQTNETRFIYDGLGVIQEWNSNNVPQVTYTRGLDLSGSLSGAGGIGGLLARSDATGHYYYHSDGNGNVTYLADANGYSVARYQYDPFGRKIGKWGQLADANVYQFSSKEFDLNSGLTYFGRRYYESSLQRWLNRDPLGERGGINLYDYVHNNPVNYVDPLGLLDYYYSGGGILQPSGPVPYLEGSSWYGQLGSAIYNAVPLAYNGINNLLAPSDVGTAEGTASGNGNYLGMLTAAGIDAAGMVPGGKCEKASEKAAKAMARKIASDLGPEARRLFHNLKESGAGDRTLDQLKADAQEVYDTYGGVPPDWMQ